MQLSLASFFVGIALGQIFYGPIWMMCLPLLVYMTSMGMIAPNAAASALMGTIQFTISAICSTLVSRLHNGTSLPITGVMFSRAMTALVFYQVLISKRHNPEYA